MLKEILPRLFTKTPKLSFCILMDLVGMATYVLPFLGEWGDTVWAPLSGYIFYLSFGSLGGMIGGAFNFLEEIIPFSDIIPTFTIAWYLQNKMNTKDELNSGKQIEDAEVIEIK